MNFYKLIKNYNSNIDVSSYGKELVMKMLINKNWKKRIKDVLVGLEDESGMGVVEIVLIIIVLVSLVVIFKKQITSLVSTLVSKMSSQAKQV